MPNPISYGNLPPDVFFIVGDQEFSVQQVFLEGTCSGFEALLLDKTPASGPRRITVVDTTPLSFKRLLDGLYNFHFCDAGEFLTTRTERRNRDQRESEAHIELEDKKTYVENFWKSVGELTELAHRYSAETVEDDIYSTLRLDSCFVSSCFVCYNQVVFAETHHYHIPQCEKHYSTELREELYTILRELGIQHSFPINPN